MEAQKSFPKWKPQRYNSKYFTDREYKVRMKSLRNSSSAFISNKKVRHYIFERDGNKCRICGSTENLQVDHIIAVCQVADKTFSISILNSEQNLQCLCKMCNLKKPYIYGQDH